MIYINQIRLKSLEGYTREYWTELPAVKQLLTSDGIEFTCPVTFIVGENGIGKSTIIEAMAINYGFAPEGGSRNFNYSTNDTHSSLCNAMTVSKTYHQARDGFFLRAESVYNAMTYYDSLDDDGYKYDLYGGRSLHTRSHGEAFLTLANNRFLGEGLYILDEPESALSPSRLLSLLVRMKDLVDNNSQFIISTHSPILMAYPGARILQIESDGIREVEYTQTDNYKLTRYFLDNPDRMLHELGIL